MQRKWFTRRKFLQSTSVLAGATFLGRSAELVFPDAVHAQASTGDLEPILKIPIQTRDVVEHQIREYLMSRVPPLPTPKDAKEWDAEQTHRRKNILDSVIFHGWPKEWINSPSKFVDLGVVPSGKGYVLRKLRYEIVPGFSTTAILYEPEKPNGKAPATINLNGHAPNGKVAEYKQKRCVNNALQGMYALSLEWLGMGEMALPENNHWNGAHLNLVGLGATGLFYLAIRRAVDYLSEHTNVDPRKIGVTGLSGGAWQSIIIAALDERVAASVPVAGYFSFTSAIERNSDVGDMEYHPHDLFLEGDYSVLTAMVAPRPCLLIYGAEDEYGLRAPMQKPHLYDEIKPFYQLYGKDSNFDFYENTDPGTHNYQVDNREHSYAFFTKHFNLPPTTREIPVDSEVKSFSELQVGLPDGNLTIIGLAKKIASENKRSTIPAGPIANSAWSNRLRDRLREVVRFKAVKVKHAWPIFSTRSKGVQSLGYRLEFDNGLSATAISLRSTASKPDASTAILLDDSGLRSLRTALLSNPSQVGKLATSPDNPLPWHINRGDHVLAVNLLFTGDASPNYPKDQPVTVPDVYRELFSTSAQIPGVISWLKTRPPAALYGLLLSAIGDRPLGMQAAQLAGITDWLRSSGTASPVTVESTGIRNQVTALVTAALYPTRFAEVSVKEGMKSLNYLLENQIPYQEAPDLFCLDLYKDFDIDLLVALAEPTKVRQVSLV
jgi:dienelactone hydrolase